MRAVMFTVVLVVLAAATTPAQQTFRVPDDHTTIQAAVNEAAVGDVVLVAPGVYVENITIPITLTVISEMGPDVTHVVGAGAAQPVVTLDGAGVFPGPRFEGFTVRDGSATGLAVTGPAILRDCVVRDNHGDVGGVLVTAISAPVVLESCTIRGNTARHGVDADGGNGCGPATSGGVGGVSCVGAAGTFFVNCDVAGNLGGDGGDVIAPCPGAPGRPGAGAFRTTDAIVLMNCTISGNVGGITGSGGEPHVGAPVQIGGFEFVGDGPVVVNTILHGNTGTSFHFSGAVPGAPPIVSHSNVEGFTGGIGNTDVEPMFVDPSLGDLRLMPTSPCIDTGSSTAPGLPITDFEGNPRVVGISADMGCDEFVPGLPGSGDAVELVTRVADFGGQLDAKIGYGGADLTAEILAHTGPYFGAVPILVGQAFSNWFAPQGLPSAFVHVDLDDFIVLHDGRVDPGPSLGFGPVTWGPVTIPHGLDTITLRLQAFALTPLALNGTYAATRARDIYFRF